jgi:hypothetical protein
LKPVKRPKRTACRGRGRLQGRMRVFSETYTQTPAERLR